MLGVLGYFRKFVRHFANIVAPILAVARKAERAMLKGKLTAKQRARKLGALPISWTPAAQQATEQVIKTLEDNCWLCTPDLSQDFYLYTDYLSVGIGGALMQRDAQGQEWPVAMVSRSLTPTE